MARKPKAPTEAVTVNSSYDWVGVKRLKTHPDNPRTGDLEEIKASIRKTGFYGALIVQKSTRTILAGNHRFIAAKEIGFETVPVIWVDVDDATAHAILVADNRLPERATWDYEKLTNLLEGIRGRIGLEGTGFKESDLGDMIRKLGKAADKEERTVNLHREAIDAALKRFSPKPGQLWLAELWLAGRHRVLCGDGTDADQVLLAKGDLKPTLMVTDPPYGVEIDHTWRLTRRKQSGARIKQVANDDRSDWAEAYALSGCDVAYVWHASLFTDVVMAGLRQAGYEVRQNIIWNKAIAPMGRSAYHWKHEPCWYAVKKGGKALWNGGRKQTTVWDAQSPIMAHHGEHDGETDSVTPHPTQKPLSLYERPIANHTKEGGVVYDPFLGSGTAIVAAHKLGRIGVGIDVDPEAVAIALQRLADFGLDPHHA